MRRTTTVGMWQFYGKPFRERNAHAKDHWDYREVNRWQRENTGQNTFSLTAKHRVNPNGFAEHRFNPQFKANRKGVSEETVKEFLYKDQLKLPTMPPPGYQPPAPIGRQAWPTSWTEEFAEEITSLSDDELREHVMESLTEVIHEESQRDGVELRRLDMEGLPMTELPVRDIIEHYNLEEETLRDRVLERVLEEGFGFVADSTQREELKSVPAVVDFVVARVTQCRVVKDVRVTDAVLDFLAEQPLQPEFGYQHVIPQDTRMDLVKAWEAQFFYKWQFGNAPYTPRDREEDQLTPAFLEETNRIQAHEEFMKSLQSGELKRRHLERVKEAAQAEAA